MSPLSVAVQHQSEETEDDPRPVPLLPVLLQRLQCGRSDRQQHWQLAAGAAAGGERHSTQGTGLLITSITNIILFLVQFYVTRYLA